MPDWFKRACRAKKSRASNRQLQVSAGLLFDVLSKYDPEHLLLRQARQEALEQELHLPTMERVLAHMERCEIMLKHPARHTPFSFGLSAESFRGHVSNETWNDRVRRMCEQQERDAETGAAGRRAAKSPGKHLDKHAKPAAQGRQ
ncbi:hypothetical protein V8Z74_10625 [Comamonas sp. w2-DMI]|uniref:hypothetical protein n=1 Tax=Comamonas sp. w2-DMI TaxID=3126391 RepID=UPI0032E464CF